MNSTGDKSNERSTEAGPQSGEAASVKGGEDEGEASERVASATDPEGDSVPPKVIPTPISSSPIIIGPDSLPPPSENVPPSTVIENAMMRGRKPLPLSTIIAVGAGIFVVLVGLSLLLFR